MTDWDTICKIEPMLLDLERDAKLLGPDPQYHNYEIMKRRMNSYVGWASPKPELRGSDVWDLAMDRIAMRCAP